jgi:putative serine protease PepD
VVAIVAAAVVLAVVSGLLGGWAATQLSDDPSVVTRGDGRTAAQVDPSSLADIVSTVQPSVVSISTGTGEGSGVVLDTDGHVLTNHHVVAPAGGDPVTVTFSDGDSQQAEVVGSDARSDIAVLRVEDTSGATPAVFGDSDVIEPGDPVLALGSPLGLEGTVTSGIVSAKNRTIQVGGQQGQPVTSISGMLQTDAAINPGNSGGALADTAGEVVGINSAIATAGGTGNIGVGFAIPSNTATGIAEQLINGEQISHPYLGVSVADANGGGALVQDVADGGPADEAGLRTGDVITEVGGEPVRDADELVAAVQRGTVGDQLTITYNRDGSTQEASVTLGEAPSP